MLPLILAQSLTLEPAALLKAGYPELAMTVVSHRVAEAKRDNLRMMDDAISGLEEDLKKLRANNSPSWMIRWGEYELAASKATRERMAKGYSQAQIKEAVEELLRTGKVPRPPSSPPGPDR